VLRLFVILLFSFVSQLGYAEGAGRDLLLIEAHAYRLTSDISILALQEGGRRYQQRLDGTISSGSEVAARLKDDLPRVSKQWQISVNFIQDNREVAASNSDVSFTNDLERVQGSLYERILQAKAEMSLEALNQSDRASLIALIALEQMVAEYMYYNINVFGGHAITDSKMSDNAALFRDSVAQITEHDSRRKAIEAKWKFIEKTLLNYNEQSATFIVMKTTDKIRSLLPV